MSLSTPDLQSLIETVAAKDEQARTLFQGFYDSIKALQPPAVALSGLQTPAKGSLAVTGANGVYSINVVNASQGGTSVSIYNRVSYSTIQSFGQNVTVLPISTATQFTVQSPGTELFFQLQSAFSASGPWNEVVGATGGVVASGLQSSAAQANNTVLNQSNYLYVDSQAAGSAANVRVYGAAGPYNGGVTLKGSIESPAPSATIVNVAYGSTQIVADDGEQYRVQPSLPGVFPDDWTPIGKVAVVGTGTPTLPSVTLITSGGHVISFNITNFGSGLTQLPTFTITDSTGTGALVVATGLNAGAITGLQITNGGQNYSSSPTATASGGVFSGASGGGTAAGGNGGRLTNI